MTKVLSFHELGEPRVVDRILLRWLTDVLYARAVWDIFPPKKTDGHLDAIFIVFITEIARYYYNESEFPTEVLILERSRDLLCNDVCAVGAAHATREPREFELVHVRLSIRRVLRRNHV